MKKAYLAALLIVAAITSMTGQVIMSAYQSNPVPHFREFELTLLPQNPSGLEYTVSLFSPQNELNVDSSFVSTNNGDPIILNFYVPGQFQATRVLDIVVAQPGQPDNHLQIVIVMNALQPVIATVETDAVVTGTYVEFAGTVTDYNWMQGTFIFDIYNSISNEKIASTVLGNYEISLGQEPTVSVQSSLSMASYPPATYYFVLRAGNQYVVSAPTAPRYFTLQTTGLDETKALTAQAYPSPFSDQITLVIPPEGADVTITSVTGSVVHNKHEPSGKLVLATDTYASGVYIAAIGKKIFRLVK